MRIAWRTLVPAALFVAAGCVHFVRPAIYRAIVPPALGDPGPIVAISGAAEIVGGIGLLVPATRRPAAIGLVALLVAVWPANWYMALTADRYAALAPAWVLWVRVPLQLPLIWWIATFATSDR
jgi:uncharacterized membrane protein